MQKIRLLPFIVMAAILFAGGTAAADKGAKMEKAVFAGGCFWCMEPPFEKLEGVSSVISGYMGGEKENPTYEEVSGGSTGHTEVVQVTYDPAKVSYEKLLEVFWMNIDPTTKKGQFADIGSQYRPEIFFSSNGQQTAAEKSKKKLAKSGKFDKPVVVKITPASKFFEAENYHQDYYKKNPLRYKLYRYGSGRDEFLEKVWGSDSKK